MGFIDQIIDAQAEIKNLGKEDIDFVKGLKQAEPGEAAETLVKKLLDTAEKYSEFEFTKYSAAMTAAYLDQYRQPVREWRYGMVQYVMNKQNVQTLPQKISEAFALVG